TTAGVKTDNVLEQDWEWIFGVKKAVLKSLEGLRQAKTIGSSLEGEVDLYVSNDKVRQTLQKHAEHLRYYFLVSQVSLKEGAAPADAVEGEDKNLGVKTVS